MEDMAGTLGVVSMKTDGVEVDMTTEATTVGVVAGMTTMTGGVVTTGTTIITATILHITVTTILGIGGVSSLVVDRDWRR